MNERGVLALLRHGYHPVPIATGSKKPYLGDWSRYCSIAPTEGDVIRWIRNGVPIGEGPRTYHPASWGLACGRVVGIDLDIDDEAQALAAEETAEEILGECTSVRIGRAPRRMLVYRAEGPIRSEDRELPAGGKVQVLATGRQFVGYGTHPDTGKPYSWPRGSLLGVPVTELAPVTQAMVDAFLDAMAPRPKPESRPDPEPPPRPNGHAKGDLAGRQQRWLDAMLDGVCADIRAAPNGSQERTLNDGALRVGHYAHLIGFERALAALVEAGLGMVNHNPRKPWTRRQIESKVKRGLADGMKAPKTPPEPETGYNGSTHQEPPGAEANAADGDSYSAADLEHREFPPEKFVVPGIVTEGLNILGGRPKLGKSALVLGWAVAVATGGLAMDKLRVEAGDVLYAALEDNPRRMQKRLRIVCRGSPLPARLTIRHKLRRLDDGGLDTLRDWLKEHPRASLVIIDTWGKVKPLCPRGVNAYDHDYQIAASLQQLAGDFGVAIVVVTHLRKAGGEDVFDEIGGTVGLPGAADTLAVLKRERGQADAVLHVTGREIENDGELALRFADMLWSLLGDAAEYRQSKERVEILRLLARSPDLTPKEIAERLDKKREAVRYLLHKMAAEGFVTSDAKGRYRASACPPEAFAGG